MVGIKTDGRLPDIQTSNNAFATTNDSSTYSGAWVYGGEASYKWQSGNSRYINYLKFKASTYNSIYGAAEYVIPKGVFMYYMIHF